MSKTVAGRATVRQIAHHAGVSIATVSRVSRGTGQVAPEMRRRVLAAIDELDYHPSHLGRALAERRHGAVGIVFPGLSGPYYSELIQGFESEAVDASASVHILGTHRRGDSDRLVLEMATRVDGVAVLGGTVSDTALDRAARQVPVVVLAGPGRPGVPSVAVDNRAAADAVTSHLLGEHGYRRLAFVGSTRRSPDVAGRWAGFRRAHARVGVTAPRRPVQASMQQHDGVHAAGRLLDRAGAADRPQALVCANDDLAIGALLAALGRGLRVPEDLAVTGFDDVPMASLLTPPLTTVRQHVRDMGAQTARLLLRRVAGEEVDGGTTMPTELVVRASCGCGGERVGERVTGIRALTRQES